MRIIVLDDALVLKAKEPTERDSAKLTRIAQKVAPGELVYSEIPEAPALRHTSYMDYLGLC